MEARKVYAGSRLKSCTSSPSCSGKETTRRGCETRSMESTGPGMKDGEGSLVAGDRGVDNRQCQKSAASYRRAARDADTKKDTGKVEFGVTERRARVTSHETPTTTGGEGEGLEKARVVGLAFVGGANSFLPGLEQGPRSGARGVVRLRSRVEGSGINKGSTPSHRLSMLVAVADEVCVPMLQQHPGAATSESEIGGAATSSRK